VRKNENKRASLTLEATIDSALLSWKAQGLVLLTPFLLMGTRKAALKNAHRLVRGEIVFENISVG
jgi:hypothetical protein